jgi:aryl-alcohol dehydrogenase-like predicted oxidoreductase
MQYKLFGHSGLRVSELSLGTMTFGQEWGWGNSETDSKKVFDAYVEAGGNFFDTANFYTRGTSEKLLGQFMGAQRERFVVATKYTLTMDPTDPNSGGNHRKALFQSVHASLKRLNTDYIDLLWVHAWDKCTPIEEMMRGLDDIVRQGKVLYVGISDMPAWAIAHANTYADLKGLSPFIAMQLEYSLIERTIEREYFEMAKLFDLSIAAWSPLGMGVLTGKYLNAKHEGRFEQITNEFRSHYINEKSTAIAQEVVSVAQELNRSPAQVALNWVRQKDSRIVPIIGAKSVDQLKDTLGCLNFSLDAQAMQRLDAANALTLGFPHDFLQSKDTSENIHGNFCGRIVDHRHIPE